MILDSYSTLYDDIDIVLLVTSYLYRNIDIIIHYFTSKDREAGCEGASSTLVTRGPLIYNILFYITTASDIGTYSTL